MLKKILLRKKVVVTFVGLVIAILAANGIAIPEGSEELIVKVITAIIGSFNIGQGISDGLSKGKTSAGAGEEYD